MDMVDKRVKLKLRYYDVLVDSGYNIFCLLLLRKF